MTVTTYLEKARAEFEDLDTKLTELARKREIALVRLQTLEMVAGDEVTDIPGKPHIRDRRQSTPAPHKPITSQGNRAAPGSWKAVFGKLLDRGLSQFSYNDVMQAARDLALEAPMPSVRVRVSKFKKQGLLENVTEGVYKPTKKGAEFFRQ